MISIRKIFLASLLILSGSTQPAESDISFPIYRTWALKHLLTSAPDQDLSISPLAGIAYAKNGIIKKWYNEGDLVTQFFFNILDNQLRCSAQSSNPTLGLSLTLIARWIKYIKQNNINDFLADLRDNFAESHLTAGWFELYSKRNEPGRSTRRDFRKKITKEFCRDLQALIDEKGEENAKNQLIALLITFAYLKDLADGAKDQSYNIGSYFKEWGGASYKKEFYTQEEKAELKKKFLSQPIDPTVTNLEDSVFLLSATMQSEYYYLNADIAENSGLCVETAIRSLVNSLLYNPTSNTLDPSVLPPAIQKSLNPEFKAFIAQYPDPQIERYYIHTFPNWIALLSSIPNTEKSINGTNSLAGTTSNLLIVLEYLFGVKASAFQEFTKALSTDMRTVTIEQIPTRSGVEAFECACIDRENNFKITASLKSIGDVHVFYCQESENNDYAFSDLFLQSIKKLQQQFQCSIFPIFLSRDSVNYSNHELKRPLHTVTSIEAAQILFEHGALINGEASLGRTPLFYAKTTELAEFFIRNGSDLRKKDRGGMTACEYIQTIQLPEVAHFLQTEEQAYADQRAKELKKIADQLAANNQARHIANMTIEQAQQYIEQNNVASLNTQNDKGETPLLKILLSYSTSRFAIRLLIEKGVDLNIPSQTGVTTLLIATGFRPEFVQMLLEHGANPSPAPILVGTKLTPLLLALQYERDAISKLLLQYGADVHVQDSEGKGPLDYAKTDELKELIRQAYQKTEEQVQ